MKDDLPENIKKIILVSQKNEITEYFIYNKLSKIVKDPHNKDILEKIAKDELKHYNFWKKYTDIDIKPQKLTIWKYYLISRIFGITFGIKLMERGEEKAQEIYGKISEEIPEAKDIVNDEDEHEKYLIEMIDEERLRYIGSVVLGLNDALVELTGTLAGLTLALQNTKLIAMAGLITGTAASLSMAASEYLSTKSEENTKDPFRASSYTGAAYILTVLFLIFPYLIFSSYYISLGITILNAIIVIFTFTYYLMFDKTDVFFQTLYVNFTTPVAFYSHSVFSKTYLYTMVVLVVLSLINIARQMPTFKILTRKHYRVFNWLVIMSLLAAMTPFFSKEMIPVISIGSALVIAYFLDIIRRDYVKEIFFTVIILITILAQIFM